MHEIYSPSISNRGRQRVLVPLNFTFRSIGYVFTFQMTRFISRQLTDDRRPTYEIDIEKKIYSPSISIRGRQRDFVPLNFSMLPVNTLFFTKFTASNIVPSPPQDPQYTYPNQQF